MSAAGSTSTLTSPRRPGSEEIESPRRAKRRPNRVPVLLALPAGLILLALLGYPIFLALQLSFQKYGLKELIQRHGEWIGHSAADGFHHHPGGGHGSHDRGQCDRQREQPVPQQLGARISGAR